MCISRGKKNQHRGGLFFFFPVFFPRSLRRTFLRPSREATGATAAFLATTGAALETTAEPMKVEVIAAILIVEICVRELMQKAACVRVKIVVRPSSHFSASALPTAAAGVSSSLLHNQCRVINSIPMLWALFLLVCAASLGKTELRKNEEKRYPAVDLFLARNRLLVSEGPPIEKKFLLSRATSFL